MNKDKISKTLVICVILLFISVGFQPAFANDNIISIGKIEQQPKGETFVKTFGGPDRDVGYSVQQTTDGGYIITGVKDEYVGEGGDVWLIKTDSTGNKEWDKTFGGTNEDIGYCVQQTTDGGYIISGIYDVDINKGHICLIKTDSAGILVWEKTYGEMFHSSEDRSFVQQTTDGGYIIVGGWWLIKTDSDGNMEWEKDLSGWCNSVQQTTDGGYIIAGENNNDVRLIKTNSTGKIEWARRFGEGNNDKGYCAQQTIDGGYIILGKEHNVGGGSYYAWLIKTDSNGTMMWDKKLKYDAVGYYVQQTSDGGYIITGYADSFFFYDVWLMKTNNAGNMEWDRTFDYGSGSYCVQQTTDEGFILTGYGDADVLLMKTDELGRSRNKAVNNPILNFLQNHPSIFPLIRLLLLKSGL
jgi:hypothetical protein